MIDREKVIWGLQEAVDWLSTETSLTVVDQWVVRDALALLEAQEVRVMTLEEVITRRGEPVWFESKSGRTYNGYVLIYDVQEGLGITGVRVGITQPGHTTIWPSKDLYGVKWRCWTSRPTDEQREVTPWN